MKRVCAWCGWELNPSEARDEEQVTHGLCADCRSKFFASAKAKKAPSAPGREGVGDAPGMADGEVTEE
jgi:hypothetical protein